MNLTDELGVGVAWIVGIAAAVTALGILGRATRKAWMRVVGSRKKPGWMRRAITLVDELADLPATVRRLTTEQIRVAAAVLIIQKEMRPNGGSSLRDSNNRIEAALGTTPTQEDQA